MRMTYQEMVWSSTNHDVSTPERYAQWLNHLTDEEALDWYNGEMHRCDAREIRPILEMLTVYMKRRGLA